MYPVALVTSSTRSQRDDIGRRAAVETEAGVVQLKEMRNAKTYKHKKVVPVRFGPVEALLV